MAISPSPPALRFTLIVEGEPRAITTLAGAEVAVALTDLECRAVLEGRRFLREAQGALVPLGMLRRTRDQGRVTVDLSAVQRVGTGSLRIAPHRNPSSDKHACRSYQRNRCPLIMHMQTQHWAVSARYAAPGSRPGNRRHPAPEDFCRRTVIGPAAILTVEAVLDLLKVPEDLRAKIRTQAVVQAFVEGKLIPDQPYPHHTEGGHYVSTAHDAQLVEWSIAFAFVSQLIVDQGTVDPALEMHTTSSKEGCAL